MPIDPVHLIPPRPPEPKKLKWHETRWVPWLVFLFGATFLIVGAWQAARHPSTGKQYMVIIGLVVTAWVVIDLYRGWQQDGLTGLVVRARFPILASAFDNTKSSRMGIALLALVFIATACGIYVGLASFTAMFGKP